MLYVFLPSQIMNACKQMEHSFVQHEAVKLNAIHLVIIDVGVTRLRLYIHLILSCSESSFASLWATVCSSWVRINAYTSCRSVLNPEGDTGKKYITEANCMMSRPLVFGKGVFLVL